MSPARSVKQQRLMAMALHNPGAVSAKNQGVLNMSPKTLRDFASTKVKKLPRHKRG